MLHSSPLRIVAVVALAAFAALVALAARDDRAHGQSAVAAFSILDRPATVAAADDPAINKLARHRDDLDLAAARPLDGSAETWLIPTTSDQICVAGKTGIGVALLCDTIDHASNVGFIGTARGKLVVVVPDSVNTVITTDIDGRTSTLPVKNNTIASSTKIVRVTYNAPGGAQDIHLSVPSRM